MKIENKTKVKIYDYSCDNTHYLLLRDNELAFLHWLGENEYLDSNVDFDILSKETDNPIEF